jgi:ABC-type amino acid transport substrate-binding protein
MIAIGQARRGLRSRRALGAAAWAALLLAGCSKEATEAPATSGQAAPIAQPATTSAAGKSQDVSSPLEILVENAADPFSRADGTGYANDLVKAAFAAVDVPVTLTVVPYVRCKAKVLDGSAAVCVSMSWDPSFEGRVKFSDAHLIEVHPVYFENPAHPLVARSEAELGSGIRIGTIRGYEYPDTVMAVRARGGLFVDGASEVANLKKLVAGRLDAAMVMDNKLTGTAHWLREASVTGLVREAFRSASSEVGFLGVSTAHPRGLAALEQFNRGMAIVSGNGTLEQLTKKWSTSE